MALVVGGGWAGLIYFGIGPTMGVYRFIRGSQFDKLLKARDAAS